MPYYCTVPRCTSMAGKAKNVSFHQFPRDEEMAKLWNEILKRGKPYTKYSKVCSLHFTPQDYTISSAGKIIGQWRTLRKDAIPSQNLPSESPTPSSTRGSSSWHTPIVDPRVHTHMAQAIYMQTMLAMHASADGLSTPDAIPTAPTQTNSLSEYEKFLHTRRAKSKDTDKKTKIQKTLKNGHNTLEDNKSFKCEDCSKCFKDPDVLMLHKRSHAKQEMKIENSEKENLDINTENIKEETLKANPILANLLKSTLPPTLNSFPESMSIPAIDNHVIAALSASGDEYLKKLLTMNQSENPEVRSEGDSYQDIEYLEEDYVDSDTAQSDTVSENNSTVSCYKKDFLFKTESQ